MLGAKCRKPLGHDIDPADDTDVLDGGEVARMLVGHAAGAEDKKTHWIVSLNV
jgi:hypothetical protein